MLSSIQNTDIKIHKKKTETNSVQIIPLDVWETVTEFLDISSLLTTRTLSNEINTTVNDSKGWKNIIYKEDNQFLPLPSLSWFENYKEIKVKQKEQQEKQKILDQKFFGRRACKRARPPPSEERKQLKHTFKQVGGFTAHPDDQSNLTISMKSLTYLKQSAFKLIELESQISEHSNENFLKFGLERYKKFMDLKSKYPDAFLVPTIDIECIWMSHLIRPSLYQKDCKKLYNKVIDHHLSSKYDFLLIQKAMETTSKLWKDTYKENYNGKLFEKYSTNENKQILCIDVDIKKMKLDSNFKNVFSISFDDVKKDRDWVSFYNSFMSTHFDRSGKLDQLEYQIKSYERFMYMNAVYPEIQGHPSYAIDLIWHAHMAHPLDYLNDCENVVGFFVDHSPWPDKFDDDCQEKYQELWEKEFSGNSLEKDHMLLFKE
eukprot:gene8298-122_t